MRCDFRRGFGDRYWRCPRRAAVFFWNINRLGGVCDDHLDIELERTLEVLGTYVLLSHATELGVSGRKQ